MNTPIEKRPWYKEPLVWLLILFPSLAIVGGIVAVSTSDGLVVDDYYKKGLEIGKTLDRDKAATAHQLQADVEIDTNHQRIRLLLTGGADGYRLPSQVRLDFHHRTQSGLDQVVTMNRIADTLYQGELPELIDGSWYILLTADDWRLLQSVSLPLRHKITIKPLPVSSS